MKQVQDVITELVIEGQRIVYPDDSSKRIKKTTKDRAGRGRGGLGSMQLMLIKDPRSGSLDMCQPSTDKLIMGQNDSDELTGEASGVAPTEDMQTASSNDNQEDQRGGGGVDGH